MSPTCYIVAGPNGAGKTTFAQTYLPKVIGCTRFVNADAIAAGLSPLNPEDVKVEAGKLLFHKIEAYAAAHETFAFESTLSGLTYLPRIRQLQGQGYQVVVHYLHIPAVSLAISRVKNRVLEGGHHIPEADIRRRFQRS